MHKQIACTQHGGTFETSPCLAKGEVSMVRRKHKSVASRALAQSGTRSAIDYSLLGVAADLPERSGRGGARNRADRESHGLTRAQVANFHAATTHAAVIGLPFTRMITIHWQTAGVPLHGMPKATGSFIDYLTKTLARHGSATAYIWCHEGGDRKGGHLHLLAHVPAELTATVSKLQRGWLRRITGNAYRRTAVLSTPVGGRRGLERSHPDLHGSNLEVAFGYLCKGAPQSVLDHFKIDRLHAPGGLVIGKRCGASQNIGKRARDAYREAQCERERRER